MLYSDIFSCFSSWLPQKELAFLYWELCSSRVCQVDHVEYHPLTFRIVLLNDFIVCTLYRHSAWLTLTERMKWTKYVCSDFSALAHRQVKERFHINPIMAILRKELFIFLINPVRFCSERFFWLLILTQRHFPTDF